MQADALLPATPAGSRPARDALLVAVLALVVRLLALLEVRGSLWNEVLLGDARHFAAWGEQIAAGNWLGSEVFYQAPLYPYLLGLLTWLFGSAQLPVQLLQITCAALAIGVLTRATARAFSPGVGRIAGGLLALYGPALWYDLQVEKTSLAVSLTVLLSAFLLGQHASARRWFGAGLMLGALALLRENALILGIPLALASTAGAGRRRRLVALAGGVALWLLPVAVRNHALGGAFLPTTSNVGVNFYIGNGPEADGMYRPLVAGRGHPEHEREDATRIASELTGRSLTPHEVSAFWLAEAREGIAESPGRFAALLARKVRLLCDGSEIMDSVAFEVFQDESLVLRILAWLSFGLLLPLAAAGLVLACSEVGARRIGLAAGLLALSILAFFVVGRFRLGLVPLLAPLAALTLVRGHRSSRRGPALIVLLATGILCAWPLELPGDARSTSYANLASELMRRGDPLRAEAAAARAREFDRSSAEAAYNHGLALRALGRAREAREPFEEAARLEPAYEADCLAEIGAILATTGDPDGAREYLMRALSLDPHHEQAGRYLRALDGR